jgi:multidrug resistance efflux pump
MTQSNPLKAQLDLLFQQEISPEQFYRQYLGILVQALQGMSGCHLWLLQGSQFVPLGGSDRAAIQFDSDEDQKALILDRISECARLQKTIFEPAAGDSTENKCPFGLAFTPLLYGEGGGAVQGAQVSWWRLPVGSSLPANLPAILDDCARSAARMARIQKLESMSQISEGLQLMAKFLDETSAAPDLRSLSVTIVNRARELVGCDRCALVVSRSPGEFSVEAISNVPSIDPRSSIARTILQMAENAKNTGLPTGYRKANEKTEEKGDLSDYFYHSRMEEVLVAGIQTPQGEVLGMIVLESANIGFFNKEKHQTALSLGNHSLGALRRTTELELMPLKGFSRAVVNWRQLPAEERRRRIRSRLWIPLAVVLAILLFPVKYEFSGDARLMPSTRALAVAEVPGRIVEILRKDGEPITTGQPLAKLDDSDIRKQRDIAAQEEQRLAAEADALTAQNERTAARISELAYQKARSEREYLDSQLERAFVRSPINGMIMTPNLSSRQGDAVPLGGQIALIGDPSVWELEINLPEGDIAQVLSRLAQGRKIDVRYLLASLPNKKFHAEIQGASAVAAASEVVAGKNVFRITVPVTLDSVDASIMRAGYTGRARLEIGRRPLVYTATRRFLNWLRTHVLF